MKAMIFAAGVGKRLGQITQTVPKALVEIGGKSILRICVEKLNREGFDDIIINVHHLADMLEKEVRILIQEGFRISVSDERDELLETGGGLFKARWFFGKEPFLVYNTDIISNIDLSEMMRSHIKNDSIATLAVAERDHDRVFLTDDKGLIFGWKNRKTGERIISREITGHVEELSFSGIHIVNPRIFSYMSEGVYSMTSLYLDIAGREKISTYRHDNDLWIDIGTPEQLDLARRMHAEGRI